MADKSIMQCKKEGHKNQKFMFLNMSSENKEELMVCPICIQQKYLDKKDIPSQKNQKTLLIDELMNDQVNDNQLVGWPPIQEEKHIQIHQNHTDFIKQYNLENGTVQNFFTKKIEDFYEKLEFDILKEIKKQKKNTIIWLENYYQNNFQNLTTEQEQKNIQEIIQKFDIKNFKEKFQEFEKQKINIGQLFDYKQEQNNNIYNNNQLYESLEKQYKKVEELKQELEKEFCKINESLEPFKNYLPKINSYPQQQNQQQQQKQTKNYLKLYKSDFNSNNNKGDFEVNNDQKTIKFKSDQYSYIYSENSQQEQEYHLRFTMDTKNNVKNISLAFSLTSGNEKNSKDLRTDHYVRVFWYNKNSSASGGEFKVEGKEKFSEFFKDKQTIMNVVFNIEKKFMEIYDDDKISYQRLAFNQSKNNFEEWILGIRYCFKQYRYQEVDIQFID
ncbi:hypothetical protein PPERSA_07010 [Pseudocohnilembus persalinus]|uniref:Uncharacterized protein n=1 Tax=Pseudocohnilembus persalinus TaxID=266149 RepID=A0A0V0Q7J5_PSEPJ|nr:hypothetical protein PPERSA_07010 [Pseudocohnilembus persalinus]|eukprot:KRW98201.1 hypothetical protein PPERSA_07010 [Pseudocohnilembus persalinus]